MSSRQPQDDVTGRLGFCRFGVQEKKRSPGLFWIWASVLSAAPTHSIPTKSRELCQRRYSCQLETSLSVEPFPCPPYHLLPSHISILCPRYRKTSLFRLHRYRKERVAFASAESGIRYRAEEVESSPFPRSRLLHLLNPEPYMRYPNL